MKPSLFLERTFDPGLCLADAVGHARASGWCLDLYKVQWHGSFLSAEGHRMVCWFSAPDAESVRMALRQAGADIRVLWSGTVHDGVDPAAANVIVERTFPAPASLEDLEAREDAGAWCMRAHQVRFARSFVSADCQRMLCLYEAPDAESVRIAQHKAGMPLDTAWAFHRIGPEHIAATPPR